MITTIDGFNFDIPPTESEIIALAQYHRKQLDEAIYHQEIHLGDYCIAQRKRVHDFTSQLDPQLKALFYRIYDGELKRLADEDELHPADAESGLSLFAIGIVLVVIAFILYFAFVRALMN